MSIKNFFFSLACISMIGCGKRSEHPHKKMLVQCRRKMMSIKCLVRRADACNNYACALAHVGQCDKAACIWKKLVHNQHYLTPEVAHYNLAKYYLQADQLHTACAYLVHALRCDPSYVDARFLYAAVRCAMRDSNGAQAQLARILSLEPRHEGARELLQVCRRDGSVSQL